MSAKLIKSSDELDQRNEFTKFSFDSVLLETKVYRRVCESSWIREVSTALEDGKESNRSGPASIMSVYSNSAIASEGDCASWSGHFGVSEQEPSDVQEPTISEFSCCTYPNSGPPTLEISASNSSEETGESSSTKLTKSTIATTSLFLEDVSDGQDVGDDDKDDQRNKSFTHLVSVVVEGVGTDSTELAIHDESDQYDKIQEAILHIRDLVLLAGDVDPGSYCGACVSSTIETNGQSDVHRFPLTPEFLVYAVNKLRDGFYESFEILARFASSSLPRGTDSGCPCSTTSGPVTTKSIEKCLAQVVQRPGDEPRHLVIPPRATLPFIESSEPGHRARGGFSDVWRVTVDPAYLERSTEESETPFFAVKRYRRSASAATMFRNEVRALKAMSSSRHPHLIQLLATFHWRGFDHLLLPWAEGNLEDFWKLHPNPASGQRPRESLSQARWLLEQCLGLVDGLNQLHLTLNPENNTRVKDAEAAVTHGRHGDIKPQNILCFRGPDKHQGIGVWKLADFGLTEFQSSSMDPTGPEARGGTETYGAPELEYHSLGWPLSSLSDIWSLGCVFSVAAAWACHGSKGVDGFKRSRYARPSHCSRTRLTGPRYKQT